MSEELSVEKLNDLYSKAETCDRELFAEIKSNVLLVSGKHYQNTSKRLWNRIRNVKGDEQTKIRLVKNHINKITRIYINEILSSAPGVRVLPHAESELQDQKAAEIANAVWQDAKHRYRLQEKIRDLCEDFVDLGECAVKIFWDKNRGTLKGYEQEVDEQGYPLFTDQMGQTTIQPQSLDPISGQLIDHEPLASNRPVYSGDFVFETILPFNLLRDPQSETMNESRYIIVRKMMDIDAAKALCGGDEEKLEFIQESSKTTFKIFDGGSGDFVDSKDQVLIKEIFYRPCHKYPNGWYALYTDQGIILEQELPFGIFPIVWAGFQKIQTTPRAHSIIRNLRPLQANLNQLSSQQIQHQLTLGDDKLIIQAGARVEKGGELPGIRVLKVSGAPPTILAGRVGEQFLTSIEKIVDEMYDIANLGDIKQDLSGQVDPNTLLFRSMRHKKKFSLYAEIFETFLRDVCQLYLKLAQKYLPDDTLIRKVGRREHINIAEFKEVDELSYSIKLESIGEDLETMLGKSLQIQQVLQYIGKDLPPEAKGTILTAMPFLNGEQMFSDLTMDVKNTDSDILALDRGLQIPAKRGENHKYIIKRLTARMKMKDFDLLDPQIQANYEDKRNQHEQLEAEELAEIKRMQEGFIPMDGPLVGVDVFTTIPNANGGVKTVRARVPQNAINWLMKQLEVQGAVQKELEMLPEGDVAGIANSFMNMNQAPNALSGVSNGMPNQSMTKPGQGAMNGSRIDFNPRAQLPVNRAG